MSISWRPEYVLSLTEEARRTVDKDYAKHGIRGLLNALQEKIFCLKSSSLTHLTIFLRLGNVSSKKLCWKMNSIKKI